MTFSIFHCHFCVVRGTANLYKLFFLAWIEHQGTKSFPLFSCLLIDVEKPPQTMAKQTVKTDGRVAKYTAQIFLMMGKLLKGKMLNNKREGTFVSFFFISWPIVCWKEIAFWLTEFSIILGNWNFFKIQWTLLFSGFQFHHNITKPPPSNDETTFNLMTEMVVIIVEIYLSEKRTRIFLFGDVLNENS